MMNNKDFSLLLKEVMLTPITKIKDKVTHYMGRARVDTTVMGHDNFVQMVKDAQAAREEARRLATYQASAYDGEKWPY